MRTTIHVTHTSSYHGSGLMELAEFSDLVGELRKAQSHAMASELGSLRAQLGKPPSPSARR